MNEALNSIIQNSSIEQEQLHTIEEGDLYSSRSHNPCIKSTFSLSHDLITYGVRKDECLVFEIEGPVKIGTAVLAFTLPYIHLKGDVARWKNLNFLIKSASVKIENIKYEITGFDCYWHEQIFGKPISKKKIWQEHINADIVYVKCPWFFTFNAQYSYLVKDKITFKFYINQDMKSMIILNSGNTANVEEGLIKDPFLITRNYYHTNAEIFLMKDPFVFVRYESLYYNNNATNNNFLKISHGVVLGFVFWRLGKSTNSNNKPNINEESLSVRVNFNNIHTNSPLRLFNSRKGSLCSKPIKSNNYFVLMYSEPFRAEGPPSHCGINTSTVDYAISINSKFTREWTIRLILI